MKANFCPSISICVFALLLASCNAMHSSVTPNTNAANGGVKPLAVVSRGLSTAEILAQIDPTLPADEIAVVEKQMEIVKDQLPRDMPILFMYFAADGKNYANSRWLQAAMQRGALVAGTRNRYQFPDGETMVLPDDSTPTTTSSSSIHPLVSQSQIGITTGTGPYRRVLTPPGYAGIDGSVYIPCGSSSYVTPPGATKLDGGYAMFGGWSVSGISADAGLEDFMANTPSAGDPQNEAVFVNESSTIYNYRNGVYWWTDPSGVRHEGTGYNAHLRCDQIIGMRFSIPTSGSLVVQATGLPEGGAAVGHTVTVVASVAVSATEWPTDGGGSNGVILKRFTGLAQDAGDHFDDQSYFGGLSGNPIIHWLSTDIAQSGNGTYLPWDGSISGTRYDTYPVCPSPYNIVYYQSDGTNAKSYAEYDGIWANNPFGYSNTCYP